MDALLETLHAIQETRALGQYRFRARNQWLDGGHTRTVVKDFFGAGAEQRSRNRPFVIESDIPALFRGADRAMDPLELLLAAIGSSVTTTLVWHAAARGIHVDAIDTRVAGDIDLRGCLGLDVDVPAGFAEVQVVVRLEAAATETELDKLIDLARRYSPVLGTLGNATRLTVRRERTPASLGRQAATDRSPPDRGSRAPR